MAIKNRKKTEEFILKYIDKIAPGGENKKLYVDLFKSMSNNDFNAFMVSLRDRDMVLPIIAPNFGNVKLDVDRNIKICKELGLDLFQRVYITSDDDKTRFLSPQKFLVMELPCRRTTQSLIKGIRTSDTNMVRDPLTGQVTGKSQATKLSYPEATLLNGLGLENSLKELMITRGGDLGASAAMNAFIYKYGSVSHKDIANYATGVESTNTLKAFFKAAHIKVD